MRITLSLLAGLGLAATLRAEPVVVDLPDRVTVRSSVVSIGDVARLSGGTVAARERIARLDLADLPIREPAISIGKRVVEYRLRLAGIDARDFRVVGAERVGVAAGRRQVVADEVIAAARAELVRLLPTADGMTINLVRPIAVKLPEIPLGETLTVAAHPHARVTGPGRAQMDVTLSAGGERLLALGLLFEVKPAAGPLTLPPTTLGMVPAVQPVSATTPASGEVLVRARQKVRVLARAGELSVTALGEAMGDGRLGQTVQVQNVDSKKILTTRVTGPAAVEVELGGVP